MIEMRSNSFNPAELERMADRFKLLSEPSRLQIILAICTGELKVREISARTGLNPANVSKHLQMLRNTGVVSCRRVGVCRYYRITDTNVLDLCSQSRQYD